MSWSCTASKEFIIGCSLAATPISKESVRRDKSKLPIIPLSDVYHSLFLAHSYSHSPSNSLLLWTAGPSRQRGERMGYLQRWCLRCYVLLGSTSRRSASNSVGIYKHITYRMFTFVDRMVNGMDLSAFWNVYTYMAVII